jgi:hypothetical protein
MSSSGFVREPLTTAGPLKWLLGSQWAKQMLMTTSFGFYGKNRQMSMPIALVTVVHKLSIKVSSA